LDRGEQAGVAQLRREDRRVVLLRRRFEAIVVAAAVVAEEQLALRVEAKAGDREGSIRQFLVPRDLALLMADAPDAAGAPVAVDVRPEEVRQLLAAVDDAAGHRPRLGMVVLR